MKITKTNIEFNNQQMQRKIANEGCNVCPCCGENKDYSDYLEKGISNKGIIGPMQFTDATGFFNIKIIHYDKYECLTCGAEWESEPY